MVDDGSEPPLGPIAGARLVRRSTNGGPGRRPQPGAGRRGDAARGLRRRRHDRARPAGSNPSSPTLIDPRVGLVAPRVTAPRARARHDGVLARYESARSPLDLGPAEARVRARTRVSYVPGAALLLRTGALREVGGFDEDLRVGEDVDLVLAPRRGRLAMPLRADRRRATHAVRQPLRAWLAQRAAYGRSAAPLAAAPPGRAWPRSP